MAKNILLIWFHLLQWALYSLDLIKTRWNDIKMVKKIFGFWKYDILSPFIEWYLSVFANKLHRNQTKMFRCNLVQWLTVLYSSSMLNLQISFQTEGTRCIWRYELSKIKLYVCVVLSFFFHCVNFNVYIEKKIYGSVHHD